MRSWRMMSENRIEKNVFSHIYLTLLRRLGIAAQLIELCKNEVLKSSDVKKLSMAIDVFVKDAVQSLCIMLKSIVDTAACCSPRWSSGRRLCGSCYLCCAIDFLGLVSIGEAEAMIDVR